MSPESTAKTADSGIECIATRLSEDGAALDVVTSPQGGAAAAADNACHHDDDDDALTTRNAQVDTALIWHLAYCDRLFEVI